MDPTPELSREQRRSVRIVNPNPDSRGFLLRHKAVRMVRRGSASWVDDLMTAIRLTPQERQIRTTLKTALSMQRDIERRRERFRQEMGYDRINRHMTLGEIANIPVVQASKAIWGKPITKPA